MLKEKGFDLPCLKYYKDGGVWNATLAAEDYNRYENCISAPTLHEAADWLREVKGVHVYAVVDVGLILRTSEQNAWTATIEDVKGTYQNYLNDGKVNILLKTHDLAYEAGIVEALKNYVK